MRWRSASARASRSSRLPSQRATSASVLKSSSRLPARPTARRALTRWARPWAASRRAWSCRARTCSASFNWGAVASNACHSAAYSLAKISGVLGIAPASAAELGLRDGAEVAGGLVAADDHVLDPRHHLVAALAGENGHITDLLASLNVVVDDFFQLFQLLATVRLGGLQRLGVFPGQRGLAVGHCFQHPLVQQPGAHAVLVEVAVHQQALEQLRLGLRQGFVLGFGQLFLQPAVAALLIGLGVLKGGRDRDIVARQLELLIQAVLRLELAQQGLHGRQRLVAQVELGGNFLLARRNLSRQVLLQLGIARRRFAPRPG